MTWLTASTTYPMTDEWFQLVEWCMPAWRFDPSFFVLPPSRFAFVTKMALTTTMRGCQYADKFTTKILTCIYFVLVILSFKHILAAGTFEKYNGEEEEEERTLVEKVIGLWSSALLISYVCRNGRLCVYTYTDMLVESFSLFNSRMRKRTRKKKSFNEADCWASWLSDTEVVPPPCATVFPRLCKYIQVKVDYFFSEKQSSIAIVLSQSSSFIFF